MCVLCIGAENVEGPREAVWPVVLPQANPSLLTSYTHDLSRSQYTGAVQKANGSSNPGHGPMVDKASTLSNGSQTGELPDKGVFIKRALLVP